MKILDITTFFHSQSGGIRRYLCEKAEFLKSTSWQHVIVVPGKKLRKSRLFRSTIYEVPSVKVPGTGGYRMFYGLGDVVNILSEEKPNIVEVGGSYFLLPFLKSDQYKLIAYYHSSLEPYYDLFPLGRLVGQRILKTYVRRSLSLADFVVSPSRKMEEYLRRCGIDRVATVNLGCDTDIFRLKQDGLMEKERLTKKKIVYVGRLSPDKEVKILCKFFSTLPPDRFEIYVAGDGSHRDKIVELSKKKKNIVYLGFISDKKVIADLYNKGDIFVSASEAETFGLAFLEAQACGCVLVAKDLDLETQPFKEFLVGHMSVDSLCEAVEKASSSVSLPLKIEISTYVRQNFSWRNTFEKLFALYESLLT
ncbi:MAG: glycosyltransferase [Deltaproteobacteria bacterium]|nr:glycosyltransferase [Deltaproteobacteria bacterium]